VHEIRIGTVNWRKYRPLRQLVPIGVPPKRKALNLKSERDVIVSAEKRKCSVRILVDGFGVSKTQISNILHAKDELKKQWMANGHAGRMRTTED
jgi:hypothetical protein